MKQNLAERIYKYLVEEEEYNQYYKIFDLTVESVEDIPDIESKRITYIMLWRGLDEEMLDLIIHKSIESYVMGSSDFQSASFYVGNRTDEGLTDIDIDDSKLDKDIKEWFLEECKLKLDPCETLEFLHTKPPLNQPIRRLLFEWADCQCFEYELKNTDSIDERLVDIFFYGLYMDETILNKYNAKPRYPRNGYIDGYRLRIGNNATIIKEEGYIVHGVVCSLTHQEIDRLYAGAGLDTYVAESFMVKLDDDNAISTICYLLRVPPTDDESNPSYCKKLVDCMQQRNLPLPKEYGKDIK